ncbi:MAG: Gfo/Idh/MocA family oxidoreductase, partial [Phycisphaerae bacterium]
NYRAAKRARSRAEFVAKLGLEEEEIDESIYWMELLIESNLVGKKKLAALASNIFSRNIDDVARAAREGREPCVSGREAKRAVEVICAIYESARTDAPVELPLKEFHP